MSTQKLKKIFDKTYNETYNVILKFVICNCSNLNDVDDIIQETYLKFYNELKNGKEILNKQAYIIAIAKNEIIKYFRGNGKINSISIFQENNNEEFTIDLDARYRYRIRFYNKK